MSSRSRRGFTLVEIVIALVILSVVVLGVTATTATLTHEMTNDKVRVAASAAADSRIAAVQAWPDYGSLPAAFAGTESDVPDVGWTRTTTVTRVQTGGNDYLRVTVTVSGPGGTTTLQRSITVSPW